MDSAFLNADKTQREPCCRYQPMLRTSRLNRPRKGLSLLEMILATAILMAGALAIARLSFVTSTHAIRAQDDSIALQIAAYQMEQIRLLRRPAETTVLQPVVPQNTLGDIASTDSNDESRNVVWQDWSYSINVQSTRRPSITKVQINVFRFPPGGSSSAQNSDSGNFAEGNVNQTALKSRATSPLNASASNVDSESNAAAIYQRSFVSLIPTPASNQSNGSLDNDSLDNDFLDSNSMDSDFLDSSLGGSQE